MNSAEDMNDEIPLAVAVDCRPAPADFALASSASWEIVVRNLHNTIERVEINGTHEDAMAQVAALKARGCAIVRVAEMA